MGTKELEKKSSGGGLVAAWKQNPLVSTGLVLILMIVVQTAIMIYNFGEGSVGELLLSLLTNWLNILRNNAPVGIIALGMTFVIISGGIDLSVGSTLVAVGAMVMMVVDGSATGLLSKEGNGLWQHQRVVRKLFAVAVNAKILKKAQHIFSQLLITQSLLFPIHRATLYLGQVPANSASEAQRSQLRLPHSQQQRQLQRLQWNTV